MLSPGTEFAGHRIESELGRGGMAVVYLVTHIALERTRALKVLAPRLSHDPDFAARFRRESRLAASIEHPSVVPIYHAGEEDGLLYLTMRYVAGVDLGRMLAEGPLGAARSTEILTQVAAGLDAAHAIGLVHRDVKPANVLLEDTRAGERAYLTDFGISKALADSDSDSDTRGLTATGAVLGTADYMAPEQIDGLPLDPRTDVYALACVAFEVLTGQVPFPSHSRTATLAAHGTAPRPRPSAVDSRLPETVDAVLARGMAIDPGARTPSATQFAREMEEALAGGVVDGSAPTAAIHAAGVADGAGGLRDARPEALAGEDAGRRPGGRRLIGAALAVLAVAAVAAALVLGDVIGSDGESSGTGEPAGEAAREGEVVASVDVARGPVAVSSGRDTTWVVSRNADVLRAIDTETSESVGPRLAVDHPRSVAVGFGSVWVVNRDSLLRFSPEESREPQVFEGFNDPSDVAVDRDYVWVADREPEGAGRVVRFEPEFETIDGEAAVDPDPRALAVGEGFVWVVSSQNGTLTRVDRESITTRDRPIPIGKQTTDVAVGMGRVWITDNLDGILYRVDPEQIDPAEIALADPTFVQSVPTGLRPRGVTVGLGSVWVTNSQEGTVWQFDPESLERVGEPIEVGGDPADLDTGSGAVWTADYADSTVSRIEP